MGWSSGGGETGQIQRAIDNYGQSLLVHAVLDGTRKRSYAIKFEIKELLQASNR